MQLAKSLKSGSYQLWRSPEVRACDRIDKKKVSTEKVKNEKLKRGYSQSTRNPTRKLPIDQAFEEKT